MNTENERSGRADSEVVKQIPGVASIWTDSSMLDAQNMEGYV